MEVEAANYYSRSVQVMRIVPQSDDRLGKVVLVAEDAEGCGAEHKITPARRFEAEPACGEHPQNMGARKHQDVALDGAYTIDNTVGSRATWSGVSPPGQPSRNRYQSGRSFRIS